MIQDKITIYVVVKVRDHFDGFESTVRVATTTYEDAVRFCNSYSVEKNISYDIDEIELYNESACDGIFGKMMAAQNEK